MGRLLLRRLIGAVIVMVVVSFFVFVLTRLQGDPRLIYLSGQAQVSQAQWDAWGKKLGLDRPLIVQYLIWLRDTATGNLGRSLVTNIPVSTAIAQKLGATAQLALSAFLFALLVGVPLGILSAVKRGTIWDYIGRAFASLGQALPPFWVGIELILLFAVHFHWLPVARRGGISHFILPMITLGWLPAAGILRLMRSSMLDVLDSQYIVLARAKGIGASAVVFKHALRNAAITPLTFAGLLFAGFITGTVVTETVFAWPGLGLLSVQAVTSNDFPTVMGVVLFATAAFIVVQFFVDILYSLIDPRIRF